MKTVDMKAVAPSERRIVNIHAEPFEPWPGADGADSGQSTLQLNPARAQGVGFHVFRMAAGARTDAHEHTEDEEFLVLSGELMDNDGTVYREGDLVWMRKGTQHDSWTEKGCTLAVYIGTPERLL